MKNLLSLLFGVCLIILTSCTENSRAKRFGGTITINLPKDMKIIEATWKEDNLWYLMRKRRANESKEEFQFVEESSFGVIEGKIIFKER